MEDEGDVSWFFKVAPSEVADRETVWSRVCEALVGVKVVFWSTSGLGVGFPAVTVKTFGALVDDRVMIGATTVVTLVVALVTAMGLPVVSVIAGFVAFLFITVVSIAFCVAFAVEKIVDGEVPWSFRITASVVVDPERV